MTDWVALRNLQEVTHQKVSWVLRKAGFKSSRQSAVGFYLSALHTRNLETPYISVSHHDINLQWGRAGIPEPERVRAHAVMNEKYRAALAAAGIEAVLEGDFEVRIPTSAYI